MFGSGVFVGIGVLVGSLVGIGVGISVAVFSGMVVASGSAEFSCETDSSITLAIAVGVLSDEGESNAAGTLHRQVKTVNAIKIMTIIPSNFLLLYQPKNLLTIFPFLSMFSFNFPSNFVILISCKFSNFVQILEQLIYNQGIILRKCSF